MAQETQTRTLYQPRGLGWGGSWEGGSRGRGHMYGFLCGSDGKASVYSAGPWVGKILWRRKWQPTPVLLPGKSHGQRSPVSYSPWCRKELDTTERLPFPSIHG